MINFYEELGLNQSSSLEEINRELTIQESLWTRRQVNNPEKATDKLSLINRARKAFASDASRRAYDNELAKSNVNNEPVSPERVAKQEKKKWQKQAEEYFSEQQYDLAKVAIKKALSFSNMGLDDDKIFALAAEIYRECGHLDLALDYVNKAIVQAPDLPEYYLIKALIFERKAIKATSQNQIKMVNDYYNQVKSQCQIAINKADNSGDSSTKAKACGVLAFTYCYKYPINYNKAEQYAFMAQRYGGDPWKNAEIVLDEINRIREIEEQERKAKEQKKVDDIYNEANRLSSSNDIESLQNAIEKFRSISDTKACLEEINMCLEKIETIKAKEVAKEKARKRRRLVTGVSLGTISLIAVVAIIIFSVISNIEKHKCGENAKWEYNDGILSIYGEGEIDNPNWGPDVSRNAKKIEINNGITILGEDVLHFDEVSEVIFPNTLKRIKNGALYLHNSKDLELPNGLEIIDEYAFDYINQDEIYIPASVKYISDTAFSNCDRLKKIKVDEDNPFYSDIDGVLFNKTGNVLITYPSGNEDIDYTIPNIVDTISFNAFYNCKLNDLYLSEKTDFNNMWIDPNRLVNDVSEDEYGIKNARTFPGLRNRTLWLKNVYADDNSPLYKNEKGVLLSKDGSVLYWFPNMHTEEYSIPDSVVEIAAFAFYDFNGYSLLKYITLPDTITTIGYEAFRGNKIYSPTLPKGISTIESGAFQNCENIDTLSLPSSLKSIGEWFINESTTVYYEGTTNEWENNVTIKDHESSKKSFEYIIINCSDGIIDSSQKRK